MSDTPSPSWMPASVASAARRGTATAADLTSGRAWGSMLDALRRAGDAIHGGGAPTGPLDEAAGYRHLLVLLALGIDEALRSSSDPYAPEIAPGNVDAVLKWGMDCPDAAYVGASIRGDAAYRVSGRRGTVRYLGFQVMGGMESLANVVADDLEIGPDGTFELTLSPEPAPGNWMPLSAGASSLVVRQFFYDWENETPADLRIECLTRPPAALRQEISAPDAIARHLVALGEFAEASLAFWSDIEAGGRAQGLNTFRVPNARTDMGGAAENVSVWGSWELADGEALIIEVVPPPALYWSVALGNHWWETLDYANHQASLNGHQAVLDADGAFRAVVAARDPGVANWLDTCGHRQGPMIFRWLRADDAPAPATRVVPFDALGDALPASTPRLSSDERAAVLASRRRGVRRRFRR